MKPWQTDQLEKVLAASTPEESFARIAEEARTLGFEYCAHGLRMPLPITKPRTTYFSNYAPEWQQRYHEQGYMQIDPTIAHGMRSSNPVLWTDEFFAETPQLWQEARYYGLRHGWAQSRRDPEGTYSMLVLARSEQAITAAELEHTEPRMQWLVHTSHVSMKACCSDPELEQPKIELSDREIDVLRWTAEGKTSAEIADILNISERTVNFHVNSVVAKLGACNKTSAAVRAAMLGLIW
ncbi:autoinducer binding domain-containing protein [Paucibacter sp. APW11]|uniref:Autoinducer binding domain-containing protein n=1 Tax=Roseateles aquae TaxID=3077235 RepID=A0ABU3PBF0_9BURK|nr:autoinducer binding domain-containing protein [Paucibacter sp. APW11]MDT8999869.1 autoinducer binding domain-containing protein [Paucibacter sp. APW11]